MTTTFGDCFSLQIHIATQDNTPDRQNYAIELDYGQKIAHLSVQLTLNVIFLAIGS